MALGLNIMEQEVVDMTNTLAINGLVYFLKFCKAVLAMFREDDAINNVANTIWTTANTIYDLVTLYFNY